MRYWFITFIIFSFSIQAEYLFTDKSFKASERWTAYSDSELSNLKNLFRQLLKSKTGKELVGLAQKKAKEQGKSILELVKVGQGSLTDTTLVRKFSAHHPDEVSYESNSVVYINQDLSQYDAVLDLAHELTHFVYRKNFNPYEGNFTLPEFIKNTIEGNGGEVQAFLMECKVLSELFPRSADGRYNCNLVRTDSGHGFSFKKAVDKFYQVGHYFESFEQMLENHGIRKNFPQISADKSNFISSAYGIPYPVAAFEEYQTVMAKVCENDKRRLGYFKTNKGRSPASISQFENKIKSRCP
ncbi:MAG: hypothetical protein CME62_11370 [Halobacteriovoraceae bacterium]|nr:hypothetical protein [Halobacteriovoraceae bacterium]|tara:strand:- start:28254 stop:29147 length:894 start_codon:yes stop_codon:yes gene_type:complete